MSLIAAILLHMGALCPKCGYGTRVTSKNWAKCKRCGERVRRRDIKAAANTSKQPTPTECAVKGDNQDPSSPAGAAAGDQ